MLKHLSSQKQKNYSYCVNEFKEFKDEEEKKEEEKKEEEKKEEEKKEEEKKKKKRKKKKRKKKKRKKKKKKEGKKEEEKKENICSQYCDIVKKLITDSETQITCANEIIIDDSFIQLLSNLNHHTPKVKNK